jgi:hypothetical protein
MVPGVGIEVHQCDDGSAEVGHVRDAIVRHDRTSCRECIHVYAYIYTNTHIYIHAYKGAWDHKDIQASREELEVFEIDTYARSNVRARVSEGRIRIYVYLGI